MPSTRALRKSGDRPLGRTAAPVGTAGAPHRDRNNPDNFGGLTARA